jgi:hypothetical protein
VEAIPFAAKSMSAATAEPDPRVGEKGRESFLDEDASHAVDAISKCRIDLVFQLLG